MRLQAPDRFALVFGSTHGSFTARCRRAYAPLWADRVYSLAVNGYYDDSYFPRVLRSPWLSVVQFGTSGVPELARVYNFSTAARCAILEPQPHLMPRNVGGIAPLSNTAGTLSMSTSFNESTATTWNATAELFVNTGNNSWLDKKLFVPFCTVDQKGMRTLNAFPSFGELQELGGPGPSLGMLYQEGNRYIEGEEKWAHMAKSTSVRVVCLDEGRILDLGGDDAVKGPCVDDILNPTSSSPYSEYSAREGRWICPAAMIDTCVAPGFTSKKHKIAESKLATLAAKEPGNKGSSRVAQTHAEL